jgi:hypothetical protein
MTSEVDFAVTNAVLTLCTERGANIGPRGTSETHVSFYIHNGSMFGVISNTKANRSFLRKVLRRMEGEVDRNHRVQSR